MQARICLLTEERKHESILPNRPLRENIAVASLAARRRALGIVDAAGERRAVEREVRDFGVVAASIEVPMRTLSGGNQQKALIARWDLADADVFVLVEPTRGVDVGARADIYRRLDALARAGKAIVLVSSDLPEVLALADRILVVRDGAIAGEARPCRPRRGAAEPDDPGRGGGMIASLDSPGSERRMPALGGLLSRNAMLVALVLLVVLFVATSPVFGTPGNAVNIMRQSASVLVLGLAMALVVLVGGIDLSVGSVVFASATLAGIVLAEGLHPAVAILAAIGIGAAVGVLNAAMVEGLRISPVIVTLGTMIAVRGLSLVALGRYNSWVEIKGPIFRELARETVLGIPLDAIVALALAGIVWFVLTRTTLGRAWHAAGDAPVAARLAGLRVRLLRSGAYVGCGALAGAAGVLVAARTGLISPSIGQGLEFFAIAVVALGAGGLPAGRIKVSQVVIGTLILMMIFNYMTIRGVPGTWQTTVTGALLFLAMVARPHRPARLRRRRRDGRGDHRRLCAHDPRRCAADPERARRRDDRARAGLRRHQPALRDLAESRRARRAERDARHRRGRRDDRHRLPLGRHLARLGHRPRRRLCRARRTGRAGRGRSRSSPASPPASPSMASTA